MTRMCPSRTGEVGRLVCTGLLNSAMPLIRYEVGDRVAIAPPDERCPCGRTLPILLSVEGRSDDVILTPDGRRVGRLDPVFKCDVPIREAQIVQETLTRVRMLVIPGPEFRAEHKETLANALLERVGEMEILVEEVQEIPRSANGKFRAVVSKVSQAEQQRDNGTTGLRDYGRKQKAEGTGARGERREGRRGKSGSIKKLRY